MIVDNFYVESLNKPYIQLYDIKLKRNMEAIHLNNKRSKIQNNCFS